LNHVNILGRRVPTKLAYDNPDLEDLQQVFSYLKIPFLPEINKRHPRDFFVLGRLRYKLTDENGSLYNPEIKNSIFSLK